MQIQAVQAANGGWNIVPLDGNLAGEVIGKADGISLRFAGIRDGVITGEVLAVWGLEVTHPMFFNDPRTVRGMGIGKGFDMREQIPLHIDGRRFLTPDDKQVLGAQALWAVGKEVQVFNPRVVR